MTVAGRAVRAWYRRAEKEPWVRVGPEYDGMFASTWGGGTRIGLFAAGDDTSGHADFDWFRVSTRR